MILGISAQLALLCNCHVSQALTHWRSSLFVDLAQQGIFVGRRLPCHQSVWQVPIQAKANPHAHSVQLAQCVRKGQKRQLFVRGASIVRLARVSAFSVLRDITVVLGLRLNLSAWGERTAQKNRRHVLNALKGTIVL